MSKGKEVKTINLIDVIESVIVHKGIKDNDIEEIVLYLTQDGILKDINVLRRIVKKLNEIIKYEDDPV
jgi:hypothetical protein